ncbi:hypothetical protein QJU43_05920 [Pasteurella atlantica]|uniref:hypothetical protein n=1 Tax=Pasteurellaceae TaxID=712 RepID=UPI00276FDB07|nr:hypothetical protein [Pasteurella atlantica]MDP8033935.1 hypothetical protein [Pasteurella atlantica]MDP8035808.1 hypothetical protein [Pasteurella atlantica]MDP8037819.1 hypothetical protein [Pasteurella atlantica]MDP8048205.1 hypothetical protein [Pasteurella atlantica]MDP8050165.1 hypothetical protein [Pasteurella atlantica]
MNQILSPGMLEGPRSFFTDLDPRDKSTCRLDALRSLKLQLLTKKWIVIGASSIFHSEWSDIIRKNEGLVDALNQGIIIPAIRYDYGDITGFFNAKREYSKVDRGFFIENTSKIMVWDIDFNSSWFTDRVFDALVRSNSVLRKSTHLNDVVASEIKDYLLDLLLHEEINQYLRREHLIKATKKYGKILGSSLNEYGNLVYRMSGARTVDSEGHFPQSSITDINISGIDNILSDDSIFWDVYVEAVFSNINSAVKISKSRLDSLSFTDVLTIREKLLSIGFCDGYDALLKGVKESVDIDDPEKLILHAEEIVEIALKLKSEFTSQLKEDKKWFESKDLSGSIWQMANGLSLLGGPTTGTLMGVVSTLGALPEITAPFSKKISNQISNRIVWMERFINSKIGWSHSHRGAFLSAYKELVMHGLP